MAATTFIKLTQPTGSALHVRVDQIAAIGMGLGKVGHSLMTAVFLVGVEKPAYVKEAQETVLKMVKQEL